MQIAAGNETQARKQNLFECIRYLYRTNGFFHGYGSCLTHQLTFYSAYFLVYELSKRAFADYHKKNGKSYEQNAFSLLMSGGLAGMLAWGLVYPTDSMQSIVRADRNMSMKKALQMYKLKDFYRGFTPTVIRSFPVNAVCESFTTNIPSALFMRTNSCSLCAKRHTSWVTNNWMQAATFNNNNNSHKIYFTIICTLLHHTIENCCMNHTGNSLLLPNHVHLQMDSKIFLD